MSRLAAVLVTQQRSLDAWPVKQDAPPAQPHTGDYAGCAPVEQRAAAHGQPRQQLLFVNEASFTCRSLALFVTDATVPRFHTAGRRSADVLKTFPLTIHKFALHLIWK